MNPQHNRTTTQSLIPTFGNQAQSMTSLEIAELVGKRHDAVKRSIDRLAERAIIQVPPMVNLEKINGLGLSVKTGVYNFTGEQGKRDSIIVVAQLCPEFTAKLVDRWKELEDQLKQNEIILPDFTNPADAAIAWAEQYKAKQQACIDRDHAIATKALIGQKREATAMATASKYKRENDKLKNKIAESLNFASIKKVQIHSKDKFSPYPLRKYSKEHGLEIQKVDDVNYDKVNAYHKDAWLAVYDIDISAFEMKS